MDDPAGPLGGRSRAPLALGALVALSTAVRSYFAWKHAAPTLFPDEYVYTAISRALAHGSLHVRGGLIRFPEIGEPLLAAPLWGLLPIRTAYHAVQAENALAASLTAIPIYLLARFLHLTRRYAFVCAVYGLLVPELVLISFTSSDMFGYLWAITAVLAAMKALERPTRASQLAFLALALIATLTRVEYVVLVPAYWAAALALDRRSAFKRHAVAFLSLVPAAAVVTLALVGYYQTSNLLPNLHWGRWLVYQSFLLVIETGVALVPGAIVGALAPRSRRQIAFGAFATAFVVLTLIEATKVAADASRYTGRYLIATAALTPIAFGVYLRNRRPRRLLVVGVAAAAAIAAANIPVSQFNVQTSSEFLLAIADVQRRLGIGNGSLLVAAATTACLAIAALSAYRPWTVAPLALALLIIFAGGADATRIDNSLSREARANYSPSNLTWIDDAASGPVAAIQTPLAGKVPLLTQMYWNPALDRELLFGPTVATDPLGSSDALQIAANGTLENVHGDFLFNSWATTASFAQAREISAFGLFSLWRPVGRPRIRSAFVGRYADAWIASLGLIEAWPARAHGAVEVSFRVALPASRTSSTGLAMGGWKFSVAPGRYIDVTCRSERGPLQAGFIATTAAPLDATGRRLAALVTDIRTRDILSRRARPGRALCDTPGG